MRIAAHLCAACRPRRRSCPQAPQKGDELSAPLPIFDFGDASCSTNQATSMAALHRAAQTTVDASSQVRENYGACRTARDIARTYRDEMAPLRKTISEEMAHRYKGH